MKSNQQAIGLFGGTFDPVHFGHLVVAEWLTQVLETKTTYFIPAKIHPLDKRNDITSSEHRLKMLQLATENYPDFKISDIELKREGISYSLETVKYFKHKFPDKTLFLFMGMDNLETLDQWKEPLAILKMCYIAVYNRGVINKNNDWLEHPKVIRVDSPQIEISSSHIRHRIKKGISFRSLVPQQVFEYINQKRLYHP